MGNLVKACLSCDVKRYSSLITIGVLCLIASGCGTYKPVKIDSKTGLYGTSTELEKSAIRKYETSVDPNSFKFVYLNANSNVFSKRFEFFIRDALADLGITRVVNQEELIALVKSHPKLHGINSVTDPLSIQKISEIVGPILLVDFESIWDGDVSRYVTLRVSDASNERVLLHVEQNKFIWMEVDPEAHYPVLNALRQWFKASSNQGQSKENTI